LADDEVIIASDVSVDEESILKKTYKAGAKVNIS
jgi:hypothetical protein